jgi:hydroxypyruvate isomerase
MPRFAANLSMLYPELPFLDRFDAAAKDGFKAVEFMFPYAFAATDIVARLEANGLQQVLFNAAPGNAEAGEKGLACLVDRGEEFERSIHQALDYAVRLDCPRIHVMAGLMPPGRSRRELQPVYEERLHWAAAQAHTVGRDILIEPLNTRDNPGFFLNRQDHAHEIVRSVGAANLKVQFDLYHCQIVEGDVAMKIRQYLPGGAVGHVQIAGVPQRHEPDTGELDYGYLLGVLDETAAECGWNGWVGCEYRPSRGAVPGGTSAGLGWMKRQLGQPVVAAEARQR